uniref:SWI/SNF-related matrix-associated actin-dependent regulator of chromatin subfamily A containing DEAD/H box 1 homolog n=1 Tax=Aceria tosichella TaxID=561515 RepID=A0A6G1SJ16_9ACAR
MSDSSDDEAVISSKAKLSPSHNRKRQRLLSDNSDVDKKTPEQVVIELSDTIHSDSDSSVDEITKVDQRSTNGKSKGTKAITRVKLPDDDEDEEDLDDDDLDDGLDADREDDAIIEELYDDDEDDGRPKKRSSTASKRVMSLRENVARFFQEASNIDLEAIPGVSKKKVEQLLLLRPITGWDDLNRKIQSHTSAGINEDIVINAVKTIRSRTVVEKLMSDCMKLTTDISYLVDRLPEAVQPKCIPPAMKLAPYQLIGLNWFALMHNRGINAILADEMGLGKTIQVIAFLAYLRERLNMQRHYLIIVPSSTLDNWEREFDVWCPEIRILQYYGNQVARAQIRAWVARHPNDLDVILTTYNVAQSPEDRRLFKNMKFEYIIFDEAHMLKNMKSSRYQSLIKIKAKRRILLTGTPLQNNLVELMSLLVFTMPRMFMPKIAHVEALFSSASREEGGRTQFEMERIEQAKKIMKPFVLRRLKNDVLKDLPKKSETVIRCPLAKNQSMLYRKLVDSFKREIKDHKEEILDDDSSFATDSTENPKKGAGMLMAMRKLANHPLLMLHHYTQDKLRQMSELMLKEPTHRDANKDLILEDMSVMHDYELHKLCKTYKSIEHFKLDDEVITDSGKFHYLDKLLNNLKKDNERCLLFSQFTMMLDIFEEYLTIRDFKYLRLDGSTKVSDRIDLIDEFNDNSDVLVFLLSTKAGGLGINLTAASTVVIHDIDFNPYNDKQAEDRSHRMGQTRDVKVYKLIGEGTIEEGMLNIANEKLKLGQDMSDNDGSQENGDQPSAKDMRSLLRATLNLKS